MSNTSETPINYRGYTIEAESDTWALKYGFKYRYHQDENIHGVHSIEEAKSEIDERIAEQESKIQLSAPMTVGGDAFDLRVLITALDDLKRDNDKISQVYPTNFDRVNASADKWRAVIEQAIKDAELDANTLPFPQK